MKANFFDIHSAADYIGPGAIEVPLYQTEITDIVRRRGLFGQRIKQVPATGHPSRFFEETAIPTPGTAGFVDPRNIVAPVVSLANGQRSLTRQRRDRRFTSDAACRRHNRRSAARPEDTQFSIFATVSGRLSPCSSNDERG